MILDVFLWLLRVWSVELLMPIRFLVKPAKHWRNYTNLLKNAGITWIDPLKYIQQGYIWSSGLSGGGVIHLGAWKQFSASRNQEIFQIDDNFKSRMLRFVSRCLDMFGRSQFYCFGECSMHMERGSSWAPASSFELWQLPQRILKPGLHETDEKANQTKHR